MTDAQRRFMQARDTVRARVVNPMAELIDASLDAVVEATIRLEASVARDGTPRQLLANLRRELQNWADRVEDAAAAHLAKQEN